MDKGSPEYKDAVREYARTLGLDPDKEPQYLWIVEEALTAPVPDDWEQGESDDGTIYYFNVNTEESVWEHPMDKHYSAMINTKRAEDKAAAASKNSTAATFNSAPKSTTAAPVKSAVVEKFDMEDLDEPKPFKASIKASTTTVTKPVGFGKDSQSWLLDDDDDDLDVPSLSKATTVLPKPSVVNSIKKTCDAPKAGASVVTVSKPSPTSTIAPVPATPPFQPRPSLTVTTAGSSSSTSATSQNSGQGDKIEKLEKQVDALTGEVLQLKKEREAAEKAERVVKAALNKEIDTLQRGKEQAEVEAKESNYLRMKVIELKAKVAALEAKSKHGDGEPTKAASSALTAELTAKTQELGVKCIEFDATCKELAAKEHEMTQLQAKLGHLQADHERVMAKKDHEWALKAKEHSIEVEDLKEQLLMRQATNITLQHSTGELDRLKKKCTDQEEEVRVVHANLQAQTATIADLVMTMQMDSEVKKRSALDADLRLARDQVSDLERRHDENERTTLHLTRENHDLELRLQRVGDELQRTKGLLDDAGTRAKAMEDSERKAAEEKRLAERELKSTALQDCDDAQNMVKRQQEQHVHAQSKMQLDMEEERGSVQTIEVQALKKEIESLNIDIARLRDVKATVDFDMRNLKQAMSLESSQLMQCKAQLEEFVRKDFMEKQRFDLLSNEKGAVEKKVMALEAQLQTMRSENFRPCCCSYEYDMSRAEEKFVTAEKWRLKEMGRVEQRDADILDLKEEVGRLKARNIDGENHHIINELRTTSKVLESQVKELKLQLQDEETAKSQLEKHWTMEMEHVKAQLAGQIPQLAAAATQRASDEWKRRCDDMVGKLKTEYEDAWVLEKQKSGQREAAWYDDKRELERQIKTNSSEKDFLNKEISRLEDNNKHLMEQLHTIRVYLTQRPVHSAGAMYSHVPPSANPEVVGSQHLQNQLGILHAQFQQLFDHTTAAAVPPRQPRRPYEREDQPEAKAAPYSSHNAQQLLDEKQQLVRAMEELGSGNHSDWVPVVDTTADGNSTNVSSSWHMEWLDTPKNHLAKLVGGSSSINAALYFRPPASYVDEIQWPYGAADVAAGYQRSHARLLLEMSYVYDIFSFAEIEKGFGWTDVPSTDGLWYAQDVYAHMASALKHSANFTERSINQTPDLKHLVYGHPPFTIKHGLRDSPAKTFLGAMATRSNVVLEMWATAVQVQHKHGRASGVVYNKGNALWTAQLRSPHGAVLLAAGTLNTPKLLLQSGIGPTQQLPLVHALGLPLPLGPWIQNEAVGAQLFDTHQVAVTFRAPTSVLQGRRRFGFDYLHPPPEAVRQFLDRRAGPLTSSNPVFISYESVVHPTTSREFHFQITVFPHAVPPYGDNAMEFTLCFNLNNPMSRAALGFSPNTNRRGRPLYGMLPNTTLYWDNDDDLDMMVTYINQTISRLSDVDTTPVFSPPDQVSTCDGSLVSGGSVNPYGFVMYTGYQASIGVKKHLTMSNQSHPDNSQTPRDDNRGGD
ncbi:hypothetical protein DYB35_000382 [Aphanomyces astaci]|uniref:WW domain-containing protein n=1 Tax=Aphanomyces astaci TaxID=112090 RepID=A0A3R6X6B3_APHAT|nr:hypothetical protein DYB35_000382 [Aphanomyces astaci]